MSLPIFTSPSEDFTDIDFFEFDVYVLMLDAFDPEGSEIQFQVVEEFGDGALFYLTPDYNELAFITDPDFEAPSDLDQDNVYEVIVRAEDEDNEKEFRTIYIHVQDVDEGDNDPPEFVSAGFVEVAENPEVAVYIAEAQDPDGDTVTYEITGGADQYLFSIDAETGEVYFNDILDYENPQDAEADNFYEIDITASDGYSETDPHAVLIKVTDLDDTAPVLEGDVDFSVEENTTDVPYSVVVYDPEEGDITYELGGPDGHLFQLGPDGELSFFDAPDFEAPGDADSDNVYEIEIVATDEAGNESAMQTVTVTVEDLSDSAPIITSTEAMAEFLENSFDAVYTVEAIDADVSDTVTFRFSDDNPDAGYFMIDEYTGAIYPIMPFDHEDPQDGNGDNVYVLAIIASGGGNDLEAFTLSVTILNENDNVPVLDGDDAIAVTENASGPIHTVFTSDADGDALDYTVEGADAHLFAFDPSTGELSFLSPPDFENAVDADGDNIYEVVITASDGDYTSDALALEIEVTDVTESGAPPVITSVASASTLENTAGTVYIALADDPDSPNVTFFISGGADAGLFTIDATTGELLFLTSPDYEAPTDSDTNNIYEVEIAAFDGANKSDPFVVSVTVTDSLEGKPTPPLNDFNGDSTSDVLVRNSTSGFVSYGEMHSGSATWHGIASLASDWQIAGAADLNGDATSDILVRNSSSGFVSYGEMHSGSVTWHGIASLASDWQIAGVADLNGDATSDILVRNSDSGFVSYGEMHSGSVAWHGIASLASDWQIAGVADLNGDATSDILVRNSTSGFVSYGEMHSGSVTWHGIASLASDWQIAGVADLNGDATSDILVRNSDSGYLSFGEMNNGAVTWHGIDNLASNWQIAGAADLNGDGTSDILVRNSDSGYLSFGEMNNGAVTWHGIGALSSEWLVIA